MPSGGCDACRWPGACCSGFHLQAGEWMRGKTALEVLAALAACNTAEAKGGRPVHLTEAPRGWPGLAHLQLGLPFLPLYMRPDGAWRFWCPLLDHSTGRCSDYDRRPALCRAYEAGAERVCRDGRFDPEDPPTQSAAQE